MKTQPKDHNQYQRDNDSTDYDKIKSWVKNVTVLALIIIGMIVWSTAGAQCRKPKGYPVQPENKAHQQTILI